jgi:hypothetical protein
MATCNGLVNKEACYDTAFQGKCEWAQVAATKPPTDNTNTDPTKPGTTDPTKPTDPNTPPVQGWCKWEIPAGYTGKVNAESDPCTKRDTDALCSGHDQCKWVANDNSNTDPTKPPVNDVKFACVSVKRDDQGDMATCNGLVSKDACYDTAFKGKCEWAQVGTTKPPTTDPTKPGTDINTPVKPAGHCKW